MTYKNHVDKKPMQRFKRSVARHSRRWTRTIASTVAFATLVTTPLVAAPVLDGDPATLFQVQAGECVGCTASQISQLEEGLDLLQRRFHRETVNFTSQLCVAEVSLTRDMAVLTFEELRTSGAISQNRWKDMIKAKASISGGLSPVTREEMRRRVRDRVADTFGVSVDPESALGRQIDIHVSIQLWRIFEMMANGIWDPAQWADAIAAGPNGLHPIMDAVLNVQGPFRSALDLAIIESDPEEVWLAGQSWHLTDLQEDFLVGAVTTRRDQLRVDYENAVRAAFYTTMSNGCGREASLSMLLDASLLSDTVTIEVVPRSKSGSGNNQPNPGELLHDAPDGYNPQAIFSDVITVYAYPPEGSGRHRWFPGCGPGRCTFPVGPPSPSPPDNGLVLPPIQPPETPEPPQGPQPVICPDGFELAPGTPEWACNLPVAPLGPAQFCSTFCRVTGNSEYVGNESNIGPHFDTFPPNIGGSYGLNCQCKSATVAP